MKFDLNSKQAVGIDISQEHISIVLLKTGPKGPELVKSVFAPIPEGAIKDGNIADSKLLSKTIRDLRHRNRIWTRQASVSLFGRPVVTQIMDMPKPVPTNIRQFVQNEVKNCVALPSRDITLDFCGIGSAKKTAEKRVFVVAAESEKIVELIRVCDKAGFTVESAEPALVAYLRAIHEQKITGKSKSNILVAMLRGKSLTLCVLKNGEIDFIRNKETAENSQDAGDVNNRLAGELSEVVRFYDVEDSENTGKWEITIFIDSARQAGGTEEYLKSKIQAKQLQVRTLEDACLDTSVAVLATAKREDNPGASGKPSPVAIGLATRLLMQKPNEIRINMLPQEIVKHRETQRDVLVAANVIAGVLLVMLLAINAFAFMIERATSHTISKKTIVSERNTESMILQNQQLEEKIQLLTSRLERIGQISESHSDVNWVQVFEEIRKATPGSVRISTLASPDGSRIQIEGLAMSNDAVNLFVGLLGKSKSITSVTLLDAHKHNEQSQVVAYQISCKLNI
ncbi:MAG: pilus assembly protein PilM, partial [Sedimentisphaerales bacterium]